MKFLLLTGEFAPYRGGIGSYAQELAAALTTFGHTVMVVAPDYDADNTALDRQFPFTVRRYRGSQHSFRDIPKKIRLVREIAREHGPFDVVHAIDWPFYLPLAISKFRRVSRCLVTFHGTEINYMRALPRRILLAATNFWNGWCDYITNSNYTKLLIKRRFPSVDDTKIRAIPLGVSAHLGKGRVARQEARAKLGLEQDAFVIVSLGRVVSRKGHLVVADALKGMPPSLFPHFVWYVVGPHYDAQYLADLKQAVSNLPMRVNITGALPQNECDAILSAADVSCLSGFETPDGQIEGFGLVFLEAGKFGVPSVAANVGGVSDAIIDGVTGLLVPQNSPNAIRDALVKLRNDHELRTLLGRNAAAHAAEATWERVAKQTYGLV